MLYQYSNIIIWKQHLAFTSCEHQWWFPLYFIYILMCYTIILHSFTSDLLLCGAIVIWFMGSLEKQVSPLRLLQSQHFKHIKQGPSFFHNSNNFQTHVERTARIWGTCKEDNKWDERSLSEMYVSIRNVVCDREDFFMKRQTSHFCSVFCSHVLEKCFRFTKWTWLVFSQGSPYVRRKRESFPSWYT